MTLDGAADVAQYADLKGRISGISGRIETTVSSQSLEVIQPIVDTLKVISTESPMPASVNNAHVAVVSGVIASSIGNIIAGASHAQEAKKAAKEAEELQQKSEKKTTPDDVGDEVADYILAASYSQIISAI